MPRVLLVSRNLLFSSGIARLLAHQANVEVVGQETDPSRAIECVKESKPDVVIVDSDSPEDDPAGLALAILKTGKVRVIGLGLNDNAIYIYRKERRIAHGVEDLMKAMENDLAISDPVSNAEMSGLAIARSRIYGFLGAVYSRRPDEQFASGLSSTELAAFLSALGEEEQLPEAMQEGLDLIRAFVGASKNKPIEELLTSLAVDRTKLLRGIKPGYGPPPPYEGVYAPTAQEALGQAMMGVRNLYAESGVILPEEIHDQPDFIGFELDFMRHLTEKEAEAWLSNNGEQVMKVAQKEQAFLNEHILQWVPRFSDLMFDQAQLDFYRGIARLTKGFVQGEAHTTAELVNAAQAVQAA